MITVSGQIIAQFAQPIHLSISTTVAGWKPFLLILDLSITIIFNGQAVVQSSQPLHLSSLNVTLPLATLNTSHYLQFKRLLFAIFPL